MRHAERRRSKRGRKTYNPIVGERCSNAQPQILQAASKKVSVASDIDWSYLARETEGFSGADLQALVYNAHLEVVHSTLSDQESGNSSGKGKEKERTLDQNLDVEFVTFGASKTDVASKAEMAALQRRVSSKQLFNHCIHEPLC